MDVRLPKGQKIDKEPGKLISQFMSSYTNKLARQGLDPDYVVKMEQNTSYNPHFHIQMFVDGNKAKDYVKLAEMGENLIESQLGLASGRGKGLIHHTSDGKVKNGYMIRRNSNQFESQFNACYRQMSYLAKDDVNDIIPSSERKVFYSRYNRKKCRRKN